ncbi:unnamed protein product [Ixodes persulcatus]
MVPPSSSPPDFSRLILRELRFVKKQLKTITKKLLEREEPCEPAEEACISLPLKTDADVDEIEEKLKANQEFCLQLARQLAGIGGNTLRTATARILAKLFEDSQGQKYSLYGQKGKRVFATMELFSVLQKAVRLIKGLSGATLEEIEAGAKGWLKNCRARVNSATKRYDT